MSWRDGGDLFWAIWPQVKSAVPDDDFGNDFVRSLMQVFLDFDMDPCEMEGTDPRIDRLMSELNEE